jgi:hypothetical protein
MVEIIEKQVLARILVRLEALERKVARMENECICTVRPQTKEPDGGGSIRG